MRSANALHYSKSCDGISGSHDRAESERLEEREMQRLWQRQRKVCAERDDDGSKKDTNGCQQEGLKRTHVHVRNASVCLATWHEEAIAYAT